MRLFATEIAGMDVRTGDGRMLGKLEDIVIDTISGEIRYVLIGSPTENCNSFKTDPMGRRVVGIKNISKDGDTIVVVVSA